jgi:hypothetical protein
LKFFKSVRTCSQLVGSAFFILLYSSLLEKTKQKMRQPRVVVATGFNLYSFLLQRT